MLLLRDYALALVIFFFFIDICLSFFLASCLATAVSIKQIKSLLSAFDKKEIAEEGYSQDI